MTYKIATIPGDGIGKEVVPEGMRVIDAAGEKFGFKLDWAEFPFGSDHYLKTGEVLSDTSVKELSKYDSIYLGALGDPRVKPGVLETGILLKLRFAFDQYVNLRPVKLLPIITSPVAGKGPADIDFDVVRENTEDFYVGIGGRASKGTSKQALEITRELYTTKFNLDIETDAEEIAYQIGMISREGAKRIIKYAFELCKSKGKKRVTSVDKANVLTSIYGLWREVGETVSKGYPDIELEHNYVDAITMYFLTKPEWFDVVVAPNMFGDIITDLGACIQGGIGLAASGNINPEGVSMFEPVHGSAPDIAGRGIANPVATILAGAMMIGQLGEKEAESAIIAAVETALAEGKVRTGDLGGTAKCSDMGDVVIDKLQ
jgi:tartrate dehydrogenase/decarboxylase / D-malate dehydrogenase